MRTTNSFRSTPKLKPSRRSKSWPPVNTLRMLEAHADRVNSQNPANVQYARLSNGQKEVKVHLNSLNVRNGS